MTARERVEALEKALEKAAVASEAVVNGERVEKDEWWGPNDVLDAMCALYRESDYLLRVAKAAVAWREHPAHSEDEHKTGGVCAECDALEAAIDGEQP